MRLKILNTILFCLVIIEIKAQELQIKAIPFGFIKADKNLNLPWNDRIIGLGIALTGGNEGNILTSISIDYMKNSNKDISKSFMGFESGFTGNIGLGFTILRGKRINFPILLHGGYSYIFQNKINPSGIGLFGLSGTAQCRFFITHKISLLGEYHYNLTATTFEEKNSLDLEEFGYNRQYIAIGIGLRFNKKTNENKTESILK